MNTASFIRQSLQTSRELALGLANDLRDAPLVQPSASGGNHALWILGHITYSESTLFDSFVLGKPNRCAEWAKVFGITSIPSADAGLYPSFDDVVPVWEQIRADVLTHLDTLRDDDFAAKSHAPDAYSDGFGSVGKCYAAMVFHPGFHAGQLAVIRKSLNRDPLRA